MFSAHRHLHVGARPGPRPPQRPPGWRTTVLSGLAGSRLWLLWESRALDVAVVHPPVPADLREHLAGAGYALFAITPRAQVWARPRTPGTGPTPAGTPNPATPTSPVGPNAPHPRHAQPTPAGR